MFLRTDLGSNSSTGSQRHHWGDDLSLPLSCAASTTIFSGDQLKTFLAVFALVGPAMATPHEEGTTLARSCQFVHAHVSAPTLF